jgi:hypothetical protein
VGLPIGELPLGEIRVLWDWVAAFARVPGEDIPQRRAENS